MSEPGDVHEQEADKVADKVQRKEEEKYKPEVQMKKEEDKKEAATSPVKAEEQQHTGSKAKEEEKKKISRKEEEPKPDIQKMNKKDEEKPLQKKDQAEEEKPVQKMSSKDNKEEDKTKVNKKQQEGKPEQEEKTVMKKSSGPAPAGGHKVSIEERIRQTKGQGRTLPDDGRAFLESQLGADLGEVVIHTDGEAVAMNKELGALAFTNGFDIYFNEGQYKPDTAAGRKLLAHELTHVIQQTGVSKKKEKK